MPNWERTPPVSGMSIEEMKRRVEDGIKRRRQLGELRPITKAIRTVPRGPHFSKGARATLIKLANVAIVALAEHATPGNREDYCGALELINGLRKNAGFGTEFLQHLCKGIAQEAAEASGEPFETLDQLARRWLSDEFKPSTRVISIPKTGAPSDGQD